MTNVAVRRPNLNDIDELYLFFRIVITNTYKNEGLSQLLDDIENEINSKSIIWKVILIVTEKVVTFISNWYK